MKRLAVVFLSLLMFSPWGGAASASDWPLVQKDPEHSGSSKNGPKPPLRRPWVANAGDPEDNFTTWPVVFKGTVFVSSGPAVIAVDAQNGKTRWRTKPAEGQSITAPAVDDLGVYIPVPGDRVLALDPRTGMEKWRFQAASAIDMVPTLADGRLYFGSPEAKIFYCIETKGGSEVWRSVQALEPYTSPVVSQGLVVFSTRDLLSPRAFLVALDEKTGAEVWRVSQYEGTSSPAILENRLIVGSGDGKLRSYDLQTGRQIWESPLEDFVGSDSSPAIAFGDVFVADRVGNFYRFDGDTGERKWVFSETEGTFDQSSPVIAGKTFFIGGGAGWIHAVDADSGEQLWKEQVGGFVYSGAADEERFYFGVKFRNEGVYAYEHDPEGQLLPTSSQQRKRLLVRLVVGMGILGIIGLGLLLRSSKQRESSPRS